MKHNLTSPEPSAQTSAQIVFEGPAIAPPPLQNLAQFVRASAVKRPELVALVDAATGRSYTYAALSSAIGRFAAGLADAGFKPGDTLLMLCPNAPEWPIAALGALCAGGRISGANPLYGVHELAHQMRDAGATMVFTTSPYLPTAQIAAREAGGLCTGFIVLDQSANDGVMQFSDLVQCQLPEPQPTINLDQIAALPYSSGTTGLSKGVMLSHRNLVSNALQYLGAGDFKEGDVALVVAPMFHIMGFTCNMLMGLTAGLKLVTMPRFEPQAYLKAIQDYAVTTAGGSPPLAQFLAQSELVDQFDLSSLKRLGCGAAPMGPALQKAVAERLNCVVGQGYGMTESSGCIAATHPARVVLGSCGQLLPATQVRIVDVLSGVDLPAGQSGEIWFRGPQVFKGYLNNVAATEATIDAAGWARTGDIGHIEDDGHLYVTDRLKELIKVKGFQVAPAELEGLLFAHQEVIDCAVIGRLDERSGEIPVAYVVVNRGTATKEAHLQEWLNQQVITYKQVVQVVFCDSIPKNATGKILRRTLREIDAKR